MSWLVLVASGCMESVWAIALGKSEGFTHVGPTIVFVVALVLSMLGLSFAVKTLPTGTAYACGWASARPSRSSTVWPQGRSPQTSPASCSSPASSVASSASSSSTAQLIDLYTPCIRSSTEQPRTRARAIATVTPF